MTFNQAVFKMMELLLSKEIITVEEYHDLIDTLATVDDDDSR